MVIPMAGRIGLNSTSFLPSPERPRGGLRCTSRRYILCCMQTLHADGGLAMDLAKRASAKPARYIGWYLPLMLGFVLVRPDALLQAAPNMAGVAEAAKTDD